MDNETLGVAHVPDSKGWCAANGRQNLLGMMLDARTSGSPRYVVATGEIIFAEKSRRIVVQTRNRARCGKSCLLYSTRAMKRHGSTDICGGAGADILGD